MLTFLIIFQQMRNKYKFILFVAKAMMVQRPQQTLDTTNHIFCSRSFFFFFYYRYKSTLNHKSFANPSRPKWLSWSHIKIHLKTIILFLNSEFEDLPCDLSLNKESVQSYYNILGGTEGMKDSLIFLTLNNNNFKWLF